MNAPVQTDVILREEKAATGGGIVGVLTLNKPKALNALDLAMAQQLLAALNQWQLRDDVLAVVIAGAGEKALCAGGDIVSMYRAMQDAPGQTPAFLAEFFTVEYTLDYTIRHYPKPVVVYGNGIVMGGGMGLMSGASHRIVTSSSRLAMPEITIGLYPDVGGSYFLPRLPGHSGLFLGLTGASMNGADALYLGLADVHVGHSSLDELTDALCAFNWADNVAMHDQVTQCLSTLAVNDTGDSIVALHQELIDSVCSYDNVVDVVNAISAMETFEDKWLQRAKKSLSGGSPITAHLVFEQIKRGAQMNDADCFRMELGMSCHCGASGEFQEGVRALLIDKDNAPKWRYADVAAVPSSEIEAFFDSPWTAQSHPLAKLGETE